ncbi:MAG: aspartate kinase [Alphaproteobacteria bacterium]
MSILVMKFGGTSVAEPERIKKAAIKVKREYDQGHHVVVVVSAMAGVTNQLVGYVGQMSRFYDTREYDSIVASGEQVTAGLMALALQELEVPARSWLSWQIPIHTNDVHGSARIEEIDGSNIKERFESGMVAVVAGFQGISDQNRITTLGRGGSDTSAVALAAALGAVRCDIYTDVDGVYTADPRLVPNARKLNQVSHETMLEMASLGAKVLQTRSVELAMNYNLPVQVLSSFTDTPGTLIVSEDEMVEKLVVSSVAYSRDEAKITLFKVADTPGIAAKIFGPLSDAAINVDMIVQSVSRDGNHTDMTFTVGRADLDRATDILNHAKTDIHYEDIASDATVAKISVIGVGMRSHAGVAQKMFQTLAECGANIQVIATSEIKISTLIHEDQLQAALQALHTAYGLDG